MQNKLKTVRIRKGLTQLEIAKKSNVSVRCYQKYENCKCLPNVQTAILIAKTLGVDVSELFGDDEDTANK